MRLSGVSVKRAEVSAVTGTGARHVRRFEARIRQRLRPSRKYLCCRRTTGCPITANCRWRFTGGHLLPDSGDLAAAFELLFEQNGWPPQWRDGIFDYHHFHATAHEVLGVTDGSAQVIVGGPGGRVVTITAGDALLLPAGTGHCLQSFARHFQVVAGYPEGQQWDIRREALTPRRTGGHGGACRFPRQIQSMASAGRWSTIGCTRPDATGDRVRRHVQAEPSAAVSISVNASTHFFL